MKTPIRVVTGLLLLVLSLAYSSTQSLVEAQSGNRAQQRIVPILASIRSAPVRPEWRIGSPLIHNNLTVFPVLADDSTDRVDLITLDEGLRSGKIIITELGADGRYRTINRRRVDDAEVNRLALTNRSGKALVLIAGEMILGGKQDRIVAHDCIIEASNTPVPLDVFCVEHGRWSGGTAFGQGQGSGGGAGSGAGAGPQNGNVHRLAGLTPAPSPPPPAQLAMPSIREKAQATKDQSKVWSAVAETVTVNATSTRTGTLTSVYQDRRVIRKLDGYERAFRGKLANPNIVGVVIAVGEKIVSTDVFANNSLFRAYWPKMLKSYALEAVSTQPAVGKQVSKTDAEAFLARVEGESSESRKDAYRIGESQSSAHASFELEDMRKTPTLIHFNRVSKK